MIEDVDHPDAAVVSTARPRRRRWRRRMLRTTIVLAALATGSSAAFAIAWISFPLPIDML
ncbi:MAG: hypothetical protein GY895_15925, partial [Phycisphaera sp.]|nr:hypothetical protein [Phycisphaera sp.]